MSDDSSHVQHFIGLPPEPDPGPELHRERPPRAPRKRPSPNGGVRAFLSHPIVGLVTAIVLATLATTGTVSIVLFCAAWLLGTLGIHTAKARRERLWITIAGSLTLFAALTVVGVLEVRTAPPTRPLLDPAKLAAQIAAALPRPDSAQRTPPHDVAAAEAPAPGAVVASGARPATSAVTAVTASWNLFVECLPAPGKVTFPEKGLVYLLETQPSDATHGGGLIYMTGIDGSAVGFPSSSKINYRCTISNLNVYTVLNATVNVREIFRKSIPNPSGAGTVSGPTTTDGSWALTVPKIDPGESGAFAFYVFNVTDQFVDVFFGPRAQLQGPDGTVHHGVLMNAETQRASLIPAY
jgi:hypothetical protein